MELNINLLKEESKKLSIIRVVCAIIFLLLVCSYLFTAIESESSRTKGWVLFSGWLLVAALHLAEGFGYSYGYATVKKIKETIGHYAKEKNIQIKMLKSN
ncbi:MAG: hypothetical protein LBH22_02515 [Bacteroidales bacterium]|nr:hypothetical protein [Bacteroidales bacterium]